MKNILFVINSLGSGGAERVTSKLMNHYSKSGNKVHVSLILSTTVFYKIDQSVQIHNLTTKKKSIFKFFYWIFSLKKIIKENHIDSIIAVGNKFALLCAAASTKKQKILVKSTDDTKMSFPIHLLFILFGRRITTICLQKDYQKCIYPHSFKNKFKIIGNPFDVYQVNLNKNGYHSKKIVCVGRINLKYKRQDIAIKAFDLFHKNHPDFKLSIYGKYCDRGEIESKKELDSLIEQLKLSDCITFNGDVPNIHDKIRNSFAMVHPSSMEGMPNAMIESMLLGLPVITTNWNGVNGMVRSGINGFVVPMNDYISIAEKLELLYEDETLYKKISDNASLDDVEKYKEEAIFKLWDEEVL